MAEVKSDVQLNLRLSDELKKTIEEAAAAMGQTISDFAISTLVQASRKVLHGQQLARLSARDRELLAAMLDDTSTKPKRALVDAAARYRRKIFRRRAR